MIGWIWGHDVDFYYRVDGESEKADKGEGEGGLMGGRRKKRLRKRGGKSYPIFINGLVFYLGAFFCFNLLMGGFRWMLFVLVLFVSRNNSGSVTRLGIFSSLRWVVVVVVFCCLLFLSHCFFPPILSSDGPRPHTNPPTPPFVDHLSYANPLPPPLFLSLLLHFVEIIYVT